ncbi:MAG: segregation/condensation protein A [Candidatus Hydrothermarchaeota archaeon]
MEELHPVEMLVDLVISDEMDPWQIDIAEIASRFLEKVREMVDLNLRLSGKTLLASSVLLRMKSESLLPREEPPSLGDEFEPLDEPQGGEVMPLPVPIRRRAERKATLFELVEALQRALSEEVLRKNFPREGKPQKSLVIQVDEESIKERIAKLYERLHQLAELKGVIKFSDLMPERSRPAIVELLLSLLYLDTQGKVTIWQEELFGEIFITLG